SKQWLESAGSGSARQASTMPLVKATVSVMKRIVEVERIEFVMPPPISKARADARSRPEARSRGSWPNVDQFRPVGGDQTSSDSELTTSAPDRRIRAKSLRAGTDNSP